MFYRRPWAVPHIAAAIRAQTRQPDELWLTCETAEDYKALAAENWGSAEVHIVHVVVPRDADGRPTLTPPSVCINAALDLTTADYLVYLADDSLPLPEKVEKMAKALDERPDWNMVYCAQYLTNADTPEGWLVAADHATNGGWPVRSAEYAEGQPHCRIDMTQVMHRRSEDRWPTPIEIMRIGDAEFWNKLRDRWQLFMPVPDVLDWHCQLPTGITASWNG